MVVEELKMELRESAGTSRLDFLYEYFMDGLYELVAVVFF